MPRLRSVVVAIRPSTNAPNCAAWPLTRAFSSHAARYSSFCSAHGNHQKQQRWARIVQPWFAPTINVNFNDALLRSHADSCNVFRPLSLCAINERRALLINATGPSSFLHKENCASFVETKLDTPLRSCDNRCCKFSFEIQNFSKYVSTMLHRISLKMICKL